MVERLNLVLVFLIIAGFASVASDANAQAGQRPAVNATGDDCFAARGGVEKGLIGLAFERKVHAIFSDDPQKVEALLYAFPRACRTYLISLSPTPGYVELLHSLQSARQEYEATGAVSQATIEVLARLGVTRREMPSRPGRQNEWQLVINADALSKLKFQTAAALASDGFMFIETYYQLSRHQEFAEEKSVLLDAIERSAREIMDHSDENGDGVVGWGRLWLKGRDGLMLHWSDWTQNMYFGGYTVYPRVDAFGRPTCERSLPLKEETFDHAYNDLFLLETYHVTRDRGLAERIIRLVGKSFDDTFDDGGNVGLDGTGWYYWKQLGRARGTGLPMCEVGREIKNTNFAMGVALRLYAEILKRNAGESVVRDARLDPGKYLSRAEQVISTNNWEIFSNNNFGYEGTESRNVELMQNPSSHRLMYDRTQKEVSLDAPFLSELRGVIAAGDSKANRKTPSKVTICGGDIDAPSVDRSSAGSCWNHLPFEAESYFRLMRYENLWLAKDSGVDHAYLDALVRNLAATNLVLEGRAHRYAHYFPDANGANAENEVLEVAVYGYFCMARKLFSQPVVRSMPKSDQTFLERASAICNSAPPESAGKVGAWKRGYKFHELYLSADRLRVPSEDWLLARKVSAGQ